jgi:hypothetical protein
MEYAIEWQAALMLRMTPDDHLVREILGAVILSKFSVETKTQ